MCLSLGKSLPSLGHLNQKDLLPRINGCACVLQAPNSVSLAIFCDRQFRPLTNARPKIGNGIRLDNSRAPRFGLQKVGGLKPRFRSS